MRNDKLESILNDVGDIVSHVYLAGPIERERKRWGFVDWNASESLGSEAPSPMEQMDSWNAGLYRIFEFGDRRFVYTGPFVGESCDHACAHSTPHAAISNCYRVRDDLDKSAVREAVLSGVVLRDLAAIRHSDAVIAWLPRGHCHGTIAEIGCAVGIGKPTYVGFKNQKLLDDHWFVARMCSSFGVYASARELFDHAAGWVT
jgi:Nucleoside 2-deoxyribosyltransferase